MSANTTIDGLRAERIALLAALQAHIERHGQAPAAAEMGEILGVPRSTIADRLDVLEARGYIERPGNKWKRVIRLREKALTWSAA